MSDLKIRNWFTDGLIKSDATLNERRLADVCRLLLPLVNIVIDLSGYEAQREARSIKLELDKIQLLKKYDDPQKCDKPLPTHWTCLKCDERSEYGTPCKCKNFVPLPMTEKYAELVQRDQLLSDMTYQLLSVPIVLSICFCGHWEGDHSDRGCPLCKCTEYRCSNITADPAHITTVETRRAQLTELQQAGSGSIAEVMKYVDSLKEVDADPPLLEEGCCRNCFHPASDHLIPKDFRTPRICWADPCPCLQYSPSYIIKNSHVGIQPQPAKPAPTILGDDGWKQW